MTRATRKSIVVLVALLVALSGAAVMQGAVAQQSGDEGMDEGSLEVASLTAPESVAPGSTVEVAAVVENPTDATITETVEFRVAGQVADSQLVTVEAGESTVVHLSADTEGLDAREVFHGVFAAESGQVAQLTLSESFTVDSVEAPENATVGDQVTIDAQVSNPNEFATEQTVTFRLNGQVVDEQRVSLNGSGSDTVTFTADTEGLDAGEFVHGVFTRDDGQFLQITLESAVEETPTEEPAEETPTQEPAEETPTEEPAEETPTDEPAEETPTEEPAEETPTASATFEDQASGGQKVTVDSVTVSEGGFVAIHSQTEDGGIGPVIGVSAYLEPGTHEEVMVHLFDVPGAEFDRTERTESQTLIAMPHFDTDDDETYDFVATEGAVDGPYVENEAPVVDDAVVELEGAGEPADGTETPTETPEEPAEATVSFSNQTSNGTVVVVETTVVSDGGFIAIHDERLLEGDAVGSVIGVSEYLSPGLHESVEVHLFNVSGAEFEQSELTESQTLIAMPHVDTDDDQTYDFVATDGAEDGPYTENGSAVVDPANVTIEESASAGTETAEE